MTSATWRSPLLGQPRAVDLPAGTVEVFDRGEGPPIVFSHGWLTNANLWRTVVELLAPAHRCLALDLPLGAHRRPMSAGADLGPHGIAGIIAGVVEALDLRDVTLAGNDSGGAYAQLALPLLDGRVTGLVLTACETPFDAWPPPPFDQLPAVARDRDALGQLLQALADPAVRSSPAAFGLLHKRPLPPEVSDSYALPAATDPGLVADLATVMSTATSAPVHAAGRGLIARADLPVLLAWARDDTVFPVAHAERFAEALRNSGSRKVTVEVLDDSFSFTPEDQPQALAAVIGTFLGARPFMA